MPNIKMIADLIAEDCSFQAVPQPKWEPKEPVYEPWDRRPFRSPRTPNPDWFTPRRMPTIERPPASNFWGKALGRLFLIGSVTYDLSSLITETVLTIQENSLNEYANKKVVDSNQYADWRQNQRFMSSCLAAGLIAADCYRRLPFPEEPHWKRPSVVLSPISNTELQNIRKYILEWSDKNTGREIRELAEDLRKRIEESGEGLEIILDKLKYLLIENLSLKTREAVKQLYALFSSKVAEQESEAMRKREGDTTSATEQFLSTMKEHSNFRGSIKNSAAGSDGKIATQNLPADLEKAWDENENEPLPDDIYYRDIKVVGDLLPRLSAMLDVIVKSRLQQGRKLKDVVVCVAAHGFYTQTIEILLAQGVTVVSRETERKHFQVFELLERNKDRFASAINAGQLILSSADRESHPLSYDVLIWEHPDVDVAAMELQPDAWRELPDRAKKGKIEWHQLPEGLKDDGILIIQTDVPSYFIKHFIEQREVWRLIFGRPINSRNFMLPTAFAEVADLQYLAFGDRVSAVAIFQKKPQP